MTEPRPGSAVADATPEYRILNCKPSPEQGDDWGFSAALKAGVAETAIPNAVDLRDSAWEIGNQGQTGSCVGWAAGDAVLRWHLTQAGMIAPWDYLSVRFLWMAAKETDEFTSAASTFIELEGTSLKAALDVARNFGTVTDDVLPFASGQLYQDTEQAFYATAARLKIASYFNLRQNPNAWRRWLANNGPVLTRLDVDRTWQDASSTGGRLETYERETRQGGHAVALVGYDEGGFIVRNSWGADWGDGGFAYATNAYAQDAFTEAYGVSVNGRAVAEPANAAAAARKSHFNAPMSLGAATLDAPRPVAGTPSLRRIEVSVDVQATRLARRPVSLDQAVKDLFPDLDTLKKLLASVQDDLGDLRLELTTQPREDRQKQLKGDYYALARWIDGTPRRPGK